MIDNFADKNFIFISEKKELNKIKGTEEFYKLSYYNTFFSCNKCNSFLCTNSLLIGLELLNKGKIALIFDPNIDEESYELFLNKFTFDDEYDIKEIDERKIIGLKNISFRYIRCQNCNEYLGIKVELVNSEKINLDNKILLKFDLIKTFRQLNNANGTKFYSFRTEQNLIEKINENTINKILMQFLPELNNISNNVINVATQTKEMLKGSEVIENGYDILTRIFTYLKNNDLI